MGSSSFSISARIKIKGPALSGDKNALFGVAVGAATSRYQLGLQNNNGFGWSVRDDAGNLLELYGLGGAIIDNAWHHYVVVFNRTANFAYAYKDGFLVSTVNIAAIAGTINPIGASIIDTTAFSSNALISTSRSEVQLYNRALSDSEVLYNAMHPNNPKRQGLALNLTQDSIQGAQWLDLSGNNNHGTYTNGAVPVSANLLAGR
jgi:hypothetical protein